MGGAGDPPAPVGDPPTGTPASNVAKMRCSLTQTAALVPSGESPDGTGGSPVLPATIFQTRSETRPRPMAKNIPGSLVGLCPKEPGANFRTGWTQGLWICAVGIPATVVCLAHKDATTVCPPPVSDNSCGQTK